MNFKIRPFSNAKAEIASPEPASFPDVPLPVPNRQKSLALSISTILVDQRDKAAKNDKEAAKNDIEAAETISRC